MTPAQVKVLTAHHGAGDHEHFYSVVMQYAAALARSGKGEEAVEIRKTVDEAKIKTNARPRPGQPALMHIRGSLIGILDLVSLINEACGKAAEETILKYAKSDQSDLIEALKNRAWL